MLYLRYVFFCYLLIKNMFDISLLLVLKLKA